MPGQHDYVSVLRFFAYLCAIVLLDFGLIHNMGGYFVKKSAIILSVFLLLNSFVSPALACYGVRAMAMGGAFVGVADDINSLYFNPAALAFLPEKEVGYQRAINYRDSVNYLDIFEFATPLESGAGFGLSYVNDRNLDLSALGLDRWKQSWIVLSYGEKVADNFALGFNLRKVDEKISAAGGSLKHDAIGVDVAGYWKQDKLSAGFLIQDVNKPDTIWGDKMIRNVRAGMAYRPDERMIVAYDVYDLTDEIERDYSVGVEYKIGDKVTARGGRYHGSNVYGVGFKANRDLEINYAEFKSGNLEGLKLVGIQAKY